MTAPAPFDALREPDPEGWRGGRKAPPAWRRNATGEVDAAGFHALLRSAGLPRAELLHMGCPAWALDRSGPLWIPLMTAAPLLGKIVLDYHEREPLSGQEYLEGCRVLMAWFKP